MDASTRASASSFEEIKIFKNSEGVLVSITKRLRDGTLSLALYKEFERDGETERTSYIQIRQIPQALELIAMAKAWAEEYQRANPIVPANGHARRRHQEKR